MAGRDPLVPRFLRDDRFAMKHGAPAVCAAHNSNRNFTAPAAKFQNQLGEAIPRFQDSLLASREFSLRKTEI